MPLGVSQAFSADDEATMEALRDPNEQALEEASDAAPPAQASAPAPAGEQPPEPAAEAAPAAAPAAPAPTAAAPAAEAAAAQASQSDAGKGDPARAALRAARAAERRANERAERFERELQEMKAKQPPATPPASDEITDDDIEAAAADFPILGKIAKAVRNVVVAPSPAAAPPAPAPAPMFEPRRFSDEVQELIDANADAFDWQHDPDQSRFELLDANVALLRKLPAWSSKNDAELLAEGARRVKAELGAASAPAPAAAPAIDPRAAIENAPARFPRSIGDIGSAGGRDTQTNDVARFQSLSFEDGLADLIARG